MLLGKVPDLKNKKCEIVLDHRALEISGRLGSAIFFKSYEAGILSKSTRVQNPPDQNQVTQVKIQPIKIHPSQNPPDQNQHDQNPPELKSTRLKSTWFKIHPIKINPTQNQTELKKTPSFIYFFLNQISFK